MDAAVRSLELVFPAIPHSLGEIRRAVAELVADCEPATVDGIRLALSEACANVVLHAYLAETGSIEVDVARGEDELEIVVRDHGRGFGQPSPKARLGLGLVVMQRLSESCTVQETPGGGTEVRMTFAAKEIERA